VVFLLRGTSDALCRIRNGFTRARWAFIACSRHEGPLLCRPATLNIFLAQTDGLQQVSVFAVELNDIPVS
jgi:hypothetical protein